MKLFPSEVLKFLPFKAMAALLLITPYQIRNVMAILLSRVSPWVAKTESNWLFDNARHVLGMSELESKAFARRCFVHQINCFFETIIAIAFPEKVTITGYDELERNLKITEERCGHIIITAHLGSWELVAQAGARSSRREFYVLAKPMKSKWMTNCLESIRNLMGVNVLWTNRTSILREMISNLKSNHALGFVMDQKPEGRVGHAVEFMGRPTDFVSGPAAMSKKFSSPIVSVFCLRRGNRQFELNSKVLVDNPAPFSEFEITQLLAQEIESQIKQNLEQWSWNYKRWRFKDA